MTKTKSINNSNLLVLIALTVGVESSGLLLPVMAEENPPVTNVQMETTTTPADGTGESNSKSKKSKKEKKKKEEKSASGKWNGEWPKKGDEPAASSGKASPSEATVNRENGEEPEIKSDADKKPDPGAKESKAELKKEEKLGLDPNRPFNPEAIKEYNQGVELQQQDMLNQAIQKYKNSIELDDRLERAWCNLGLIYISQRNFSKASDAFKKAIALKQTNPFSQNGMGSVYYSKGKLQDAVACWKKAIEVDPNFFSAYFNMANAWKNERDFDKALENYVMTIKTNPQMAEAFYEVGSIFAKQKHNAQALTMLVKAVQMNPEGEFVVDARKQLNSIESMMGKDDDAGEVKMNILAPQQPNAEESSK